MAAVETYEELGRRVRAAPARLGPVRLVAVDGPSGAGKTVFAGRLARALARIDADHAGGVVEPPGAGRADNPAGGRSGDATGSPQEPPVLHTDDLLDGWADQFTFWTRLEEWVLAPLRAGRPGRYRRYSWPRGEFIPRWIAVPVAPVVILEGVSAARAAIRPELSLAVFVTAPAELRLHRTLDRDGKALLPDLRRWRRAEDAHFAADDTARRADLVVDGAPADLADPESGYVRLR